MLARFTASQGYVTDHLTGAVDPVPLDPIDWNARLNVTPPPRDGEVWIVTDQGDVREVSYDRDASFWCPAEHGPYFSRTDGEPGCYGADEIMGWTTSYDDACEAAELLMRAA